MQNLWDYARAESKRLDVGCGLVRGHTHSLVYRDFAHSLFRWEQGFYYLVKVNWRLFHMLGRLEKVARQINRFNRVC